MRYASLLAVRRKTGNMPRYEHTAQTLGTGDGSNKDFYVSSGWLVDGNGDEVVDENDVTVYVDGSEVTVYEINPEQRRITLVTAAGNNLSVTAKYWVSDMLDSEILEEIEINSRLIERKTGYKYTRDNSKTEKYSGDGVNKTFNIHLLPAYKIDSITVDSSSSLTEGTDYFLKPEDTDFHYVEFLNAPSDDHDNVSITYRHGEEDQIVTQWVTIKSAMNIIFNEMNKKGDVGYYQKPQKDGTVFTATKSYTAYKELKQQLKELSSDISGMVDLEVF